MLNLEPEFPLQRELSHAKGLQGLSSGTKDRIKTIENEVKFLVMYRHCLSNMGDPPFGKKKFVEILRRSDATLKQQRRIFDEALLGAAEAKSWETVAPELLQEIQSYKKTIWEDFLVFFDCSYYCSFSVLELLKLIRYVVVLMPISGKLQLRSLFQEKLHLFGRIVAFYSEHCDRENKVIDLQSKNICALGAWVWTAASLCLLNWALDEKDENMTPKLDQYLSRSNRKFSYVLYDVTKICLSFLKAMLPLSSLSWDQNFKVGLLVSRFDGFQIGNLKKYMAMNDIQLLQYLKVGQLVSRFDGFQIGNLKEYMTMDDIQLLCDRVIRLITFLMDPPQTEENDRQLATAKVFAALDRHVNLLDAAEMNEASKLFLLPDFLEMVNTTIEAQGKVNNPESEFKSQNATTPGTSALGFREWNPKAIDSLPYDCEKVIDKIKPEVGYPSGSNNNNNNNNNVQTMMDDVVVGLESKVKYIRDKLIGGSEKLQIISIVGMPGLGKTTLAKKVYNDPSIKSYFMKFAWCTVSQSYDSKKLLLDILNDVTEVNESFFEMDEDDLANELRKCLMGQRYLIVMDDIWDVSAWKKLKLSFPDEGKWSRILFTSRIKNVGSRAKSGGIPYPLRPLSDQECWDLLERRLFHGEKKCPINLIKVGEEIAKHCEGLPLAVVLVAGLLKGKTQNLSWWEQIRDSVSSRISENGCAHIMELSYQHLTEPLKDCFLYLGLFREDKVIGVQKLTKLWISEGFVQKQDEEKNFEILAKEYVSDLVDRSLLMVSSKSSSCGIKSCCIHDLLREFCLRKSKEIFFVKFLHGHSDHEAFSDNNYRVRIKNAQQLSSFLASHRNDSSPSSSPLKSLLVSSGTFEPFGKEEELSFFCKLRHLRVLDLETVKFLGDFPEEVTKLTQLRYLAIWCTNNYVPEKIGELGNLQTFCIRTEDSSTCIFPSKLLLMENLRHVHIGKVSPRIHFGSNIPSQMKNICSFSYPCFTSGREAEIFLRIVPTIRKLRCQFSSCLLNSQLVKIGFLSNLESLNMAYVGLDFPRYEFSLPSRRLKKLTLSNFQRQWSEISRIAAELPNLEVLKLLGHSFVGKYWYVKEDDMFLKLKFLKLRGLKIAQWDASHENFPLLEQIVVEQCHKLEGIPCCFGEISTLKMIQVRRCRRSVLNSAEEIRRLQNENGNEDFELLSMQILEPKLFG